jgi:hypothetical protein
MSVSHQQETDQRLIQARLRRSAPRRAAIMAQFG